MVDFLAATCTGNDPDKFVPKRNGKNEVGKKRSNCI